MKKKYFEKETTSVNSKHTTTQISVHLNAVAAKLQYTYSNNIYCIL